MRRHKGGSRFAPHFMRSLAMKTAGTSRTVTISLTALAMVAFAANSILCRLALSETNIDPATFTIVRIGSGAAMLWAIAAISRAGRWQGGSWPGAFALFAYAAAFSFAYVSLTAGAGALLLFGAVQATMVIAGIFRGDHPAPLQWLGLAVALAGLVVLLVPGVFAPPLLGAALMLAAGIAWGAYSILGRRNLDPLAATAGNFIRAVPMALVLAAPAAMGTHPVAGLIYACLSGAAASGLGYAIWYAALPALSAAEGASVQLSVPALTALAAAMFLGEPITLRLGLASLAVLGGIALVVASRARQSE
jgi:drug/metabolite transporter (DMT)-like permease